MENEAKMMFAGPFNCAQSVLGVFADQFGLDRATALRMATPFGGGIGHSGQLCGAASGAIMAIGLAQGTAEDDKLQKDACYDLALAFMARFKERHGSITCPGLLGLDLGDPDDHAQARALGLFYTRCNDFVGDAVRITADLLGLEA